MIEPVVLDRILTERFVLTVEASLSVVRRTQFFAWSQGVLQGLLPHGVLVCLRGDLSLLRFDCDAFSCAVDERVLVERLSSASQGVLAGIVQAWRTHGSRPLAYCCGSTDDALGTHLQRLGCGHVLAHGSRDIRGSDGSFVLFMQMPAPAQPSERYLADLVMPHLHMALCRIRQHASESVGTPRATDEGRLSEREAEVLHWVGLGKTNYEIGRLLAISPFTVKNHVQRILRKLSVSNRAQAVSKVHSLQLGGVPRSVSDSWPTAPHGLETPVYAHVPD